MEFESLAHKQWKQIHIRIRICMKNVNANFHKITLCKRWKECVKRSRAKCHKILFFDVFVFFFFLLFLLRFTMTCESKCVNYFSFQRSTLNVWSSWFMILHIIYNSRFWPYARMTHTQIARCITQYSDLRFGLGIECRLTMTLACQIPRNIWKVKRFPSATHTFIHTWVMNTRILVHAIILLCNAHQIMIMIHYTCTLFIVHYTSMSPGKNSKVVLLGSDWIVNCGLHSSVFLFLFSTVIEYAMNWIHRDSKYSIILCVSWCWWIKSLVLQFLFFSPFSLMLLCFVFSVPSFGFQHSKT